MLYTTYESSGPCSFGQEDFWKLHFENLFFDPVTYLCNQLEFNVKFWSQKHNFNNFGRGPLDDAIYQIWKLWALLLGDQPGIIPVKFGQNPISGFRGDVVKRNCWRTHGRTHARTDDGRRTLKNHKSSLRTSCSGKLKTQLPWKTKLVSETDECYCIQWNIFAHFASYVRS